MIACRTRYIINTIDKKSPKLHKLRKFASMGSALTFPIQSISFYIICVAAGVLAENADVGDWKRLGRQVRVYGDDLIVPVSWMPFVEQLLKRLFLKVNRAKTFTEGNFRESCGTNAYAGHSVSPGQILHFYDESKLSTLQGVVDSSNNLFAKGFERTAQYLVSPVAPAIRKLIPDVAIGAESFGLWSAMGFSSSARNRWNQDLHRWEVAALHFRAKRSSARRHEGFANSIQYFTEATALTGISTWESGMFAKPVTVVGRRWEPVPV